MRTHVPCKHQEESIYGQVTTRREGEEHDEADNRTAATASDEATAIDVLVRAFATDPISYWIWPDSQQYHMYFPSFVRAFGGKAFTHGSAYYVDGYAPAAL